MLAPGTPTAVEVWHFEYDDRKFCTKSASICYAYPRFHETEKEVQPVEDCGAENVRSEGGFVSKGLENVRCLFHTFTLRKHAQPLRRRGRKAGAYRKKACRTANAQLRKS